MRNRIFKSVVSVVLTLAILISSDSLLWSVFAVDGSLPVGLGIYNNVYTSQDSTLTKYTTSS